MSVAIKKKCMIFHVTFFDWRKTEILTSTYSRPLADRVYTIMYGLYLINVFNAMTRL